MKTRKKLLIALEVLALTTVASIAHAENDRQVWRDSDGEVVRNSWDTCVRSRWLVDEDPCAEKQVRVMQPLPAAPHTIISEEERTVYFAFDKAGLTPDARTRLDALAARLSSADDVNGARIVGYADRIGTVSYNDRLSKKRADNVRAYLIERGFVKESDAETQWVGKSKPSANCSNGLPRAELIECLQPDRKVTVNLSYRVQTSSYQNENPDQSTMQER